MNNFKVHELAEMYEDSFTAYQLGRRLVEAEEKLNHFHKLSQDYSYMLMRAMDILERLRVAEEGTYDQIEADIQTRKIVKEIAGVLGNE